MKKAVLAIGICLSLGVVAAFFVLNLSRSPEIPTFSSVTDFQLTDSKNVPVTLDNLKGNIWVVDFFFTTCSGPCPIMTANMAKLYRSYRLEERVKMVSVTVNPENDTPAVLEEYAKRWDADPAHWMFLTGAREEIHRLAYEGFHLGTMEEPVFHSVSMVLVDDAGNIRGYYDGTEEKAIQKLFHDIARLL